MRHTPQAANSEMFLINAFSPQNGFPTLCPRICLFVIIYGSLSFTLVDTFLEKSLLRFDGKCLV